MINIHFSDRGASHGISSSILPRKGLCGQHRLLLRQHRIWMSGSIATVFFVFSQSWRGEPGWLNLSTGEICYFSSHWMKIIVESYRNSFKSRVISLGLHPSCLISMVATGFWSPVVACPSGAIGNDGEWWRILPEWWRTCWLFGSAEVICLC